MALPKGQAIRNPVDDFSKTGMTNMGSYQSTRSARKSSQTHSCSS